MVTKFARKSTNSHTVLKTFVNILIGLDLHLGNTEIHENVPSTLFLYNENKVLKRTLKISGLKRNAFPRHNATYDRLPSYDASSNTTKSEICNSRSYSLIDLITFKRIWNRYYQLFVGV